MTDTLAPYRSKTLATWLAVAGGTLGLHRMYLRGPRDVLAWLHLPPTALGLLGGWRMREFGLDDRLSWILLPVLGAMIAPAMLCAILPALNADLKAYLSTRFTLRDGDRPHLLKF